METLRCDRCSRAASSQAALLDARQSSWLSGRACSSLTRTVVCREGTQTYLDRLKKLSRHSGPDDLVFCGYDGKPVENFNKTFGTVLSRLKLLDDRWGKRRTVYSLRHFYCTQCLLSGIPVHVLAKNMGTSITYIEKHYSHVLTVMQAKELRTKKFKAKA